MRAARQRRRCGAQTTGEGGDDRGIVIEAAMLAFLVALAVLFVAAAPS